MVNADGITAEHEARIIMVSELGVPINPKTNDTDGQIFRQQGAHINWLRETVAVLELAPPRIPFQLGSWDLGTEATHAFLDQLEKAYGSRDGNIGAGGSFAIESWAGFGIKKGAELERNNFWRELIEGLIAFNQIRIVTSRLYVRDNRRSRTTSSVRPAKILTIFLLPSSFKRRSNSLIVAR